MSENLNKQLGFDPDKCSQLYQDLLTVFQNAKPTVGEIIIALGNLEYALGASIGGYKDKGPTFEELQKMYYSLEKEGPPRIDLALMLQGHNTTSFFDIYQEKFIKNNE